MLRLSGFGQNRPLKTNQDFGAVGGVGRRCAYITGFEDRPLRSHTGISMAIPNPPPPWALSPALMALRQPGGAWRPGSDS